MRPTGPLRLSPHEHSAKLLPHRHTSYGGLAILLTMVGVIILLITLVVALPSSADSGDITVSGIVPGPPPTTIPVITTPTNNLQVSAQQITVSGSCTIELTVVVSDNQEGRGADTCSQDGTFSLMISLATGSNVLTAYHLDSLNQSGPTSNPVTVIYESGTATNPAVPTASSSSLHTSTSTSSTSAPSPASTSATQFTLSAPYRFDGVQSGQIFILHGNLQGGTAPYAVQVNWGDSSQTLLSRASSGPFTAQHTYAKAGQFIIKLLASDATGLTTYYQTEIAINGILATKPATSTPAAPVVPAYQLMIIWPLFLVICLTAFSFWLGELYDRRQTLPKITP